ncbi:hypothetical protein J6590_063028 [Homalodisca vitripennis]|nr:hypothetical protein J6590_063028 [Homalodisca vitripennis]
MQSVTLYLTHQCPHYPDTVPGFNRCNRAHFLGCTEANVWQKSVTRQTHWHTSDNGAIFHAHAGLPGRMSWTWDWSNITLTLLEPFCNGLTVRYDDLQALTHTQVHSLTRGVQTTPTGRLEVSAGGEGAPQLLSAQVRLWWRSPHSRSLDSSHRHRHLSTLHLCPPAILISHYLDQHPRTQEYLLRSIVSASWPILFLGLRNCVSFQRRRPPPPYIIRLDHCPAGIILRRGLPSGRMLKEMKCVGLLALKRMASTTGDALFDTLSGALTDLEILRWQNINMADTRPPATEDCGRAPVEDNPSITST